MSYVVAFDPSTKILGWAAMDTDTGRVLAHGAEPINMPDGGWQHDQIREAIGWVALHCDAVGDLDPVGWTYERPFAMSARNAFAYGEACRSLETVCRRVWPYATVWEPFQASSWRSLVGAGGRGKEGPRRVAEGIDPGFASASQDECDAVCVARALLIEHYGYPTEVAA